MLNFQMFLFIKLIEILNQKWDFIRGNLLYIVVLYSYTNLTTESTITLKTADKERLDFCVVLTMSLCVLELKQAFIS